MSSLPSLPFVCIPTHEWPKSSLANSQEGGIKRVQHSAKWRDFHQVQERCWKCSDQLEKNQLQNAQQVLTAAQRARLDRALHSDTAVAIVTRDEAGNAARTRPSASGALTWHYTAHDVRDFAFAAGPNFRWDASGYNGTLIETLYRTTADRWSEANRQSLLPRRSAPGRAPEEDVATHRNRYPGYVRDHDRALRGVSMTRIPTTSYRRSHFCPRVIACHAGGSEVMHFPPLVSPGRSG